MDPAPCARWLLLIALIRLRSCIRPFAGALAFALRAMMEIRAPFPDQANGLLCPESSTGLKGAGPTGLPSAWQTTFATPLAGFAPARASGGGRDAVILVVREQRPQPASGLIR